MYLLQSMRHGVHHKSSAHTLSSPCVLVFPVAVLGVLCPHPHVWCRSYLSHLLAFWYVCFINYCARNTLPPNVYDRVRPFLFSHTLFSFFFCPSICSVFALVVFYSWRRHWSRHVWYVLDVFHSFPFGKDTRSKERGSGGMKEGGGG